MRKPGPNEWVQWFVGKACVGVEQPGPGRYVFDFGTGTLQVDCLWRWIEEGRLRWTSGDHGHKYGLPAPVDARAEVENCVRGRPVTGVRVREGTCDLLLEFDGGLELEVIPDSAGYEPWQLGAPGIHLIALGGGGFA